MPMAQGSYPGSSGPPGPPLSLPYFPWTSDPYPALGLPAGLEAPRDPLTLAPTLHQLGSKLEALHSMAMPASAPWPCLPLLGHGLSCPVVFTLPSNTCPGHLELLSSRGPPLCLPGGQRVQVLAAPPGTPGPSMGWPSTGEPGAREKQHREARDHCPLMADQWPAAPMATTVGGPGPGWPWKPKAGEAPLALSW